MPIIEVQGLTKTYRVFQKEPGFLGALRSLLRRRYKEVHAVADVSFTIEPGEMVAFLGPNGAGKTTTLKMLSGLIYPTTGTARVLGFTPWERPDAFRRRFSLIMGQKNQLWWDLPAGDSFQLHREIYSLPHDAFERTLGELTELFDVEKLTRQPVRELSLGERMKMELIAALLHEPQLLLLDEPTIGLDVVAQVAIQRCLKEYNVARGVTMLLTSHYMRDVEALCNAGAGHRPRQGDLRRAAVGHHRAVRPAQARPAPVRGRGGARRTSDSFGECSVVGPVAELKVERVKCRSALAAILDRYTVIDMSVQDPPLDQVIARVFEEGRTRSRRRRMSSVEPIALAARYRPPPRGSTSTSSASR